MKFSIIDQTTKHRPPSGVLQLIAGAVTSQLNTYESDWNYRTGSTCDVGGSGVPIVLKDALPEAPGAAGYHDKDAHGNPIVYIAVGTIMDNGGSWTTGANSVSQCISHEVLETRGDLFANYFALDSRGRLWALEMCDAVEMGFYTYNNVAVSDYLMPAYFDVGSRGPYNKLKSLTKPFTIQKGGYSIVASLGNEHDVFGYEFTVHQTGKLALVVHQDCPTWRLNAKGLIGRTAKRLAVGLAA